jgi:transposase InsO family protein
MYAFFDSHHETCGVEPICRVLQISPSGYYKHRLRTSDPRRRSARAQRDDTLAAEVQRGYRENHEDHGPPKVWRQLRCEGTPVARCTVDRLMRAAGLQGVVRGRRVRTTRPTEPVCERPLDLVQRQFQAERPIQLWIADFTYVATWRGFDDVEYATLEWVAWFNRQRLLEPLGYLPPAEYEEQFYRAQTGQPAVGALN